MLPKVFIAFSFIAKRKHPSQTNNRGTTGTN
jgi:hypothetical protein